MNSLPLGLGKIDHHYQRMYACLSSTHLRLTAFGLSQTLDPEHGLRPEMYERVFCNLIHDLAFTTDHDQTNNLHQAKK